MRMRTEKYITYLSEHPDPLMRWKTYQSLLNGKPSSYDSQALREQLKDSPVIQGLLGDRNGEGQIPLHPYDKWFGAHWVLSILADMGYPVGENSLKPLMEQCYAWLLSKEHEKYIRMINGRTRRCASQEGNCIYYSLALSLADERTEELAMRLLQWQWQDGGWNCDKNPAAATSSFNETLIPMRGLAWYARSCGDPRAQQAVERVAEFFLKRHLFRRLRDGKIINEDFIKLHYPAYWHYDILMALQVMAEADLIHDPRCREALDVLEGKQLPDGGFPAEGRYYRVDDKRISGHSRVDFGGTSKIHANAFTSVNALVVLKQSGRLES